MMLNSAVSGFMDAEIGGQGPFVDDRPQDGVFQVHPTAYASKDVFELEQDLIFGRTWNFLGLESQIPSVHDYFTTSIGRTPILVTREKSGAVRAFLNVCRHKGALLCRPEEGHASIHVCPYHNWSFNSSGANVAMKARKSGGYTEAFNAADHNLIPLGRLGIYNGLIFGSLSPDVPSLDDFLGDTRFLIDLAMDQGPLGMEYIPGRAPYTYHGNWKLQLDNGMDSYHVTSAHTSLLNMQKLRNADHDPLTIRTRNWEKYDNYNYHYFNFPHGHSVLVEDTIDPEKRSLYAIIDEVKERVGNARAQEMLRGFALYIFPNFQIATSVTTILRQFRPLAVDLTEMNVRVVGAIGETREQRSLRLRQFEDFFSASGLASPDDSIIFEDCQTGFQAQEMEYLQGYSRGLALVGEGANAEATRLGFSPVESLSAPGEGTAEIPLHAVYREWSRMLRAGVEGKPAYE